MTKRKVTNMAASVHDRLLERAKAEHRPFDELLQYYCIERFLHRLSRSRHADGFVLKGALMLQFWGGPLSRSTKDIDLLGKESISVEQMARIFRDCLEIDVEDDGLFFDPTSIQAEEIRLEENYHGVRIRMLARLDNAESYVQVDVGFGDVITPGAQEIAYPSILGLEAPRLQGYTPETAIAEKLQAMVALDMANSRMKDFFDIYFLAQNHGFSGAILADAIRATFQRRQTTLPSAALPVALSSRFSNDQTKLLQWRAYLHKGRYTAAPTLGETIDAIRSFVQPVLQALASGEAFRLTWPPGGPWR